MRALRKACKARDAREAREAPTPLLNSTPLSFLKNEHKTQKQEASFSTYSLPLEL